MPARKAPVGAGPYKFVSFNPGVELVMEASDQYWRKPPPVKRLVFRVIPDESTRLAALKRGEIDIVYSIRGELAEELRRTPGLSLKPAVVQGVFCLYFPDQWDPKSPWHDERVRRAASLAIDRDGTNEALTLGYSLVTGNPVVPDHYEFFWKPPAPVYDPEKAKQLLAEAGDLHEELAVLRVPVKRDVAVELLQLRGLRLDGGFFRDHGRRRWWCDGC